MFQTKDMPDVLVKELEQKIITIFYAPDLSNALKLFRWPYSSRVFTHHKVRYVLLAYHSILHLRNNPLTLTRYNIIRFINANVKNPKDKTFYVLSLREDKHLVILYTLNKEK